MAPLLYASRARRSCSQSTSNTRKRGPEFATCQTRLIQCSRGACGRERHPRQRNIGPPWPRWRLAQAMRPKLSSHAERTLSAVASAKMVRLDWLRFQSSA
jgi:hypothetical protein